jgi:hypothetical protein
MTFTVAPGVKWNVADTWVLVANVGVPLLKGGLRAPSCRLSRWNIQ